MNIDRKGHKQSKYFTIMLVPDSTSMKVCSLKVPHWCLYLVTGIIVTTALTIGGLSALNAYSNLKLEQTAKIIEDAEHEKQELLIEKEKIESAKKNIERSLDNQKGDFDKQIAFYLDKIAEIEARLIEIENQAKENYDKMNVAGSPVSGKDAQSYMGGYFTPILEEQITDTDRLNMHIASVNVQFEKTENLIKAYTEDVDKFVAFKSAIPSNWPVVGRVTSEFGGRYDPINGGAASHSGIDIKAPLGTYVKATGSGVVKRAGYSSSYGYLVIIDHGYNLETYYAHNQELLVKTGDHVNKGDYVAKSGNSGRSTGPHVHYEVRVNGVAKNPRDYMD